MPHNHKRWNLPIEVIFGYLGRDGVGAGGGGGQGRVFPYLRGRDLSTMLGFGFNSQEIIQSAWIGLESIGCQVWLKARTPNCIASPYDRL